MQNYDVVIVGGGIQGCGIAQACAANGYSCLLLEAHDWAHGTSSRSTKLIHGGLRYLQSGQFKLVRENLKERETLLKIAPSLVKRIWINIPIYKNQGYHSVVLWLGLTLYWLLTGCRKSGRFYSVKKSKWHALDGIKTNGLKKVYAFTDAQTDDAALTLAVMHSAKQLGAKCLAPAKFISATRQQDGYQLKYTYAGESHAVHSKLLINAGGPWVNQINANISPAPKGLEIDCVQGSHLLLDKPLVKKAFYLEAPQDKRAIFVLPWQGKTLVGTTEKLFEGKPNDVRTTQEEEEYLLAVLAHYFDWSEINVCGRFCGLRVLPKEEHSLFHRSRDTRLTVDDDKDVHQISVYGGKLTGYRATAEKVLQTIEKTLGQRQARVDTASIILQSHNQASSITQNTSSSARSAGDP